MSEALFDASCDLVAAQLEPFTHPVDLTARTGPVEPKIMCNLYSQDADKVLLVRHWAAFGQEFGDEPLVPLQTTYQPPETVGEAFLRKINSSLLLTAAGLRRVYGLNADRTPLSARSKHGPRRVFGVLCGVVQGLPELRPDEDKFASADWISMEDARVAFRLQAATERLRGRGLRNLTMLNSIRDMDLSDL